MSNQNTITPRTIYHMCGAIVWLGVSFILLGFAVIRAEPGNPAAGSSLGLAGLCVVASMLLRRRGLARTLDQSGKTHAA